MAGDFNLPHARDGLTHGERMVLWCLHELQQSYIDRQIPTSMLYGRARLPFDKLVSHKFPLAEVNEAFEQSEWSQRQTQITRAMLRRHLRKQLGQVALH